MNENQENELRNFLLSPEFQVYSIAYLLGKNDAFEQSAKWLENTGLSDTDPRIQKFTANMAMSLRAHRVKISGPDHGQAQRQAARPWSGHLVASGKSDSGESASR